ncbi:MAG TPA: hypothetical protein PK200_06025 [Spirochaetota bacterium]|nr:hypothetical protein [Spirochaetota bacterium]HQO02564.1 hypothetical protein [Spirochaetota bacterium]HQP48431.1 hypothetical protein [Spirochaetota bacterium]
MKNVYIWYVTDNDDGKKIAGAIKDMGLKVNIITQNDFPGSNIVRSDTNVFIIDLKKKKLPEIISMIREEERIELFLKFVILPKKEIRKAVNISLSLMHIEFISRPVEHREFVLLLEKSVVVERYKEMLKIVSSDAESRIGAFESLMDINRKDIFESDKEKEAFEKILEYEKHLMDEQTRLNRAIKEFTLMRQRELFDIKNRIKAEEMLADLRRLEMLDARNIIKAQEAVIDFSSRELKEAGKIIDATEKVQELSRVEAMELHNRLKDEIEMKMKLENQLQKLQEEIASLKG